MTKKMKKAFLHEMNQGKNAFCSGDLEGAFQFFERAHVLGQSRPTPHTLSHFWMLKVAFEQKDVHEIIGQLFRIPSGFFGSAIGLVPTGNTGGSNVSPFKRMAIPEDLKKIMDKT